MNHIQIKGAHTIFYL